MLRWLRDSIRALWAPAVKAGGGRPGPVATPADDEPALWNHYRAETPPPGQVLLLRVGALSARKRRLLGAAMCRRGAGHLTGGRLLDWVALSEGYADGAIGTEEWERGRAAAAAERVEALGKDFFFAFIEGDQHGAPPSAGEAAAYAAHRARDPEGARREVIRATFTVAAYDAVIYPSCGATSYLAEVCLSGGAVRDALGDVEALYRDITGPFPRRAAATPLWLTPEARSLALAAYAERGLPSGELDPARLAVLSDALEEAGCDDAGILAHLRSPGPHVRGCWPVDLILGKE